MDKIDAQMFINAQAGAPVGSGAIWFTATPPTHWLICDGSSLDTATYAALFAVIGYTFGGSGANFNLPNLVQVFPFGAGDPANVGLTGGEAAHVLTAPEMPVHTHAVTDPGHNHNLSDPGHFHNITDPTHTHGAFQDAHQHNYSRTSTGHGGGLAGGGATVAEFTDVTSPQQPAVHVNAATTGITATDTRGVGLGVFVSQTGIVLDNAGGGAAHNNIPPFLLVNFIIKYQ